MSGSGDFSGGFYAAPPAGGDPGRPEFRAHQFPVHPSSSGSIWWAPPRRRRRRWLVPLIVVVVLALVLSGAYALVTRLGGGGRQPESLVPANALAFAKLDLDPGLGQKVAAYRLARKIPGQQDKSDADVRRYLLGELFDDRDIDYQRDIEPWLGDRVAVAALPGSGSSAVEPLGVVQVDDETRARAFLEARRSSSQESFGYLFRDGYALIGHDQTVVDRAARDVQDGSLEGQQEFRSDVQHLHGDTIALAWTDLPALQRAAEHSSHAASDRLPVPDYRGRLVVGVSAAADALEVEGRVIGASGLPKGRDAADRLARLPAGSAAGAALDTAALTSDPDVSRALDEFLDGMDGSASGSEPNGEDIRNLLTGTAVLGLGSVPRGDDVPRFALRLEGVDDPARAEETLGSFVGDDSPPEVRVRRDGDTVVLASDSGYGVSVGTATGRTLGQDELFRQAMSGAPDQVLGAAYVAVQPFVAAADPGDVPDLARSLQAVGLTVGSDGDEIVLHARLIFG